MSVMNDMVNGAEAYISFCIYIFTKVFWDNITTDIVCQTIQAGFKEPFKEQS